MRFSCFPQSDPHVFAAGGVGGLARLAAAACLLAAGASAKAEEGRLSSPRQAVGLVASAESIAPMAVAGGRDRPARDPLVRAGAALSAFDADDLLRDRWGGQFHVLRRQGYRVVSDLPPETLEMLIDGVLAVTRQALLADYFTRAAHSPAADGADAPVTMYIFRDAASYEANLRRHFRMDPVSPYGHYAHRQRYLAVNGDTGPGTLVHEMIHSLMAVDFPEAPIWLSEGLASLYEQCRVEGGRLAGEDNWRLPELRAALDAGRLPPLAALLAFDAAAFRDNFESLCYAHARYFCLYLEMRGWLREIYRTFRDDAGLDPAGGRFIQTAAGRSLAELDDDFRRWLATCSWRE